MSQIWVIHKPKMSPLAFDVTSFIVLDPTVAHGAHPLYAIRKGKVYILLVINKEIIQNAVI